MLSPYKENIEVSMKQFYESLKERDKRRYAAIESRKLPYGGLTYISRLFECDPKTIRRGLAELDTLDLDSTRTRRPGGGRKKKPQNLNTKG